MVDFLGPLTPYHFATPRHLTKSANPKYTFVDMSKFNIKFLTLCAFPPAPSGLRWFRFKTLPIFQLGGFTLPPTPFPGLWFERIAGWNRICFRCSFRAPFFFTTWDPPKSLSQVISAPKRSHFKVQNGVQNKLPLRNWLFL